MTARQYKPGISLVLPNYNGRALLEQNLPSMIQALNQSTLEYEILVADDCSTDDSVEFLQQHYPQVKTLEAETNGGFSVNCNRGINAVQYEYICLSNTDVYFTLDYIKNSLKYFNKDNVFAVKGDIINYTDTRDNVINTEKDVRLYYKRGFLRFDHRYKKDDTNFDLQFSLLGCCFVCKSQLIHQLGGFDEIFSPFYWEDSDLALRGIALGYEVIYAPECVVYHKISSTISSNSSKHKRQLVSRRNKFLFTWKHLKGKKRWAQHCVVILVSIIFRWIILDWKFYVALCSACLRHFK